MLHKLYTTTIYKILMTKLPKILLVLQLIPHKAQVQFQKTFVRNILGVKLCMLCLNLQVEIFSISTFVTNGTLFC